MFEMLKYSGNFFQSEDWFGVLAETTDVEPIVLTSPLGALPCKRNGRHLESLTNFYSVEYSPIGYFGFVLDAVGERIDLKFLKDDHDDHVEQVFRNCGFTTFRHHQYANWTCPIESGFAPYFKARPSRLRNTVTRRSKALLREGLEMRIFEDPRPDEYLEIYNASWKKPEPYERFIPELMLSAARLGILRVGVAYIDGEPAAAQLWLVESGKATIYKLAYKEKFKSTSVGTVLSHEMFRNAIDVDNVSLIDYGVGDDAYKRDWMTQKGDIFQLTCIRKGSVRAYLETSRQALKRILRRRRNGVSHLDVDRTPQPAIGELSVP